MNALIIADDAEVKEKIKQALYEFDSTSIVFETSSPKEALKLMQSDKMSVVFSEIQMRQMNGLSFVETHKRAFPGICWLVISACKNFYDIKKAIQLGVVDYLLKPVDETGLRDVLEYRVVEKSDRDQSHPCAACH
ncbi:response regulator [Saccharibacillus sacchari]|uniref:Response regulator n=1 Tax=Saccharibacillus sacchari TaxID=456493 RepID=A0ACC6PJU1_9BACL